MATPASRLASSAQLPLEAERAICRKLCSGVKVAVGGRGVLVGPEGLLVAVALAACVPPLVLPLLVAARASEQQPQTTINAPQPRPICTARDVERSHEVARVHCSFTLSFSLAG